MPRSTTLHNFQFFCPHTLFMNYVTNTFLLVSSSVRCKQLLCFVQGQRQKSEQKHTTKNFDESHNHSPLLTMTERRILQFWWSKRQQNVLWRYVLKQWKFCWFVLDPEHEIFYITTTLEQFSIVNAFLKILIKNTSIIFV